METTRPKRKLVLSRETVQTFDALAEWGDSQTGTKCEGGCAKAVRDMLPALPLARRA